MPQIVILDEAASTNTEAALRDPGHATVIACRRQTAGRGQRGNSWEAAPGENLTFSVVLRPRAIAASRQFEISEIVSLAIVDVLRRHLGDGVAIKWPNDIYYRDLKICGILIENTVCADGILRSVVGVGINVNQEKFLSDAPNPVSMRQVTHTLYPLDALLEEFANEIIGDFDRYEAAPDFEALHGRYFSSLWRGMGYWTWLDAASGEKFDAQIAGMGPMGHITLSLPDGSERVYAFKEVAAVL